MRMPDAEVAIRAELHTLKMQMARQKATITRTQAALDRNEERKGVLERDLNQLTVYRTRGSR